MSADSTNRGGEDIQENLKPLLHWMCRLPSLWLFPYNNSLQRRCGGLWEKCFLSAPVFKYLALSWWCCFLDVIKHLGGTVLLGSTSLGVGSESLYPHLTSFSSVCFLSIDEMWSRSFSLLFLPPTHGAPDVLDSICLDNQAILSVLSRFCSWDLITAIEM